MGRTAARVPVHLGQRGARRRIAEGIGLFYSIVSAGIGVQFRASPFLPNRGLRLPHIRAEKSMLLRIASLAQKEVARDSRMRST